METIEWSGFKESCRPEIIENVEAEVYSAGVAEKLRREKKVYVEIIFDKLGPEAFVKVLGAIHKKCFGDIQTEELSQHIMYRALNGAGIDLVKEEKVEFVFDLHDRVAETLLGYVECTNDVEHAKGVIDSITIDFSNFE